MASNPFTFIPNSGGGRPTEVWRGEFDVEGSPVYEAIDYDSGKYVAPVSGQYTLMVTGYTPPRTQPIGEKFLKPNGPTERTLTDVELEIVSDRGKGFRFFWSFQTFSLSCGGQNPANLGRIYIAAVTKGAVPPKGQPLQYAETFNKPFDAYVIASDEKNDKGFPKFANLAKESIRPHEEGSAEVDPFAAALAQAS